MDVSAEHKLVPMQMNQKFQEIGFILMMCSARHHFLLLVIPLYSNPQQNASCMSLKADYLKPGKHGMDLSSCKPIVHWLRRRVQKVKLESVSVSPLGSDSSCGLRPAPHSVH